MELIKELGFEKLPTLSEFIVKQRENVSKDLMVFEIYKARDVRIMSYLVFLQQKPELWMFVPSIQKDGVWVVLEKPEFGKSYPKSVVDEYQEALDRVLFDGCKLHAQNTKYKQIISKEHRFDFIDGKLRTYNTLEQAVNNGIELKLKPAKPLL